MNTHSFPLVSQSRKSPNNAITKLLADGVLIEYSSSLKHTLDAFLYHDDFSLNLVMREDNKDLSLNIDFTSGKSRHRLQYGGGKNQPLAKACGLNKHPEWSILDGTAGLAKDAFVLASLGSNIILCEQHPALYSLLIDATQRALDNEETALIAARMKCIHTNSTQYLNELNDKPDVIYLDPMYPDRKKSAKIKKEMQILQYLVSHSSDDIELFLAALATAVHRVVVKRPKSAAPLNDKPPSYSVSSVNTRYDVYVI